MITGFNTDIVHDGVVYHVQTEDKGLKSPIILSLVYIGGAILVSKRTPYQDLIERGFDAQTLGERLQRQHKLICAAINAGRIEDLKRLNQPEPTPATTPAAAPAPVAPTSSGPASTSAAPVGLAGVPVVPAAAPALATGFPAAPAPPHKANGNGHDEQVLDIPIEVLQVTPLAPASATPAQSNGAEFVYAEPDGALHLSLLEEREFYAGEVVTIRVRISRGPIEDRGGVADAQVTVKVLGTDFRPLILRSKSDQDGVAVVHAWLPRFTTGRAAVLVRATTGDGFNAELRRVIHHSK